MTLSLCAIALNEEQMLPGLLRSVAGLVDEIVIGIDTRTTDSTERIACSYRARVKDVDWRDDFSYARNLTIEAATGDWILVLDADERLRPAGAAMIRDVIANSPEVPAPDAVTGLAFWIGQCELNGTMRALQVSSSRLFRRRPEIRYRGTIHEEISWLPDPQNTTCMIVKGVRPHFIHYGYDPVIWNQRGKYARNLKLLEQRVADDPEDEFAQGKLRALQLSEDFIGAT